MADLSTVPDEELLRKFSESRSENSFRELVERHIGLVHAVATRVVGNPSDAPDIVQDVFSRLAQAQGKIPRSVPLPVWLYQTARSRAASFVRSEQRRRRRQETAAAMLKLNEDPTWTDLEPIIDTMIGRLPKKDRAALVLRFFGGLPHAKIGAQLGLSEEAARKRVARSLRKLHQSLSRRGIATTTTFLGVALGSHAAAPVPPGLVASIAGTALGPSAGAATLSTLTSTLTVSSVMKSSTITALTVLITGALTYVATSHFKDREIRRSAAPPDSRSAPRGSVAHSPSAGLPAGDLTLEKLRAQMSAWASRQSTAALWRQTEKLSFQQLESLLLEILSSDSSTAQDRELSALLLEQMLHLDLAGAIALHDQLSTAQQRAFPLNTYIRTLASIDPAAATEVIARLEPGRRGRAYGILVDGLSLTDPAHAISLLRSLPAAELADGLGNPEALARLAAENPTEVAALLDRIPMTNRAADLYARVAETWVRTDPVRSLAWARGLELEGVRSNALLALYRTWATLDRERAMKALTEIPDSTFRDRVFHSMASELIRREPDRAAEWARSLQGPHRDYALGLVGREVARSDPREAARYLEEAATGTVKSLALPSHEIGFAFAQRDPLAASAWAQDLPTEKGLQQHAVEGVTRAWVRLDPVAAAEWIGSLPPGGARNGAIYHLVGGIRTADPATAFTWASAVQGDDEKRLYLLKLATDSWTESAPGEVRAAIEKLALSPNESQDLLSRLRY